MESGKYNFQILPSASHHYNENYFSNMEDYQKMKTFLDNTRTHLEANNKEVKEGLPYGLIEFNPITILQSQAPVLRKLELNHERTKRRKKRKR